MPCFRILTSMALAAAVTALAPAQSPTTSAEPSPRLPAYVPYSTQKTAAAEVADRPVQWPVTLLADKRAEAPNGCYTMRSYRFTSDATSAGLPMLSGSTTCQSAAQFQMKHSVITGTPTAR